MHIVLGVSATSDVVTAALVDVELPQLGPVDERVTQLTSGAARDVGAAVATSIGVMRLRAERADLTVTSTAVGLASPELRGPVVHALTEQHLHGVDVVDGDALGTDFDPVVEVALWSDTSSADAATGPIPIVTADNAMVHVPESDPQPSASERRRGFAVVGAGIAAAVLAGSFAVWAVTGTRAPGATVATTPVSDSTSESAGSSGPESIDNPAVPGAAPDPSSPQAPTGAADVPRSGTTTNQFTLAPGGVLVGVAPPVASGDASVTESAPGTSSSTSRPVSPTRGSTGGGTSGGSGGGSGSSGNGGPAEPSGPGTSEPDPTDPGTTDPGPTDPGPTDPGPTDPGTTDPVTPGTGSGGDPAPGDGGDTGSDPSSGASE